MISTTVTSILNIEVLLLARKGFDKVKFSELLVRGMGQRNMSQFALHSGVSLTYLSRLIRQLIINPPQPETIQKLASKAYNGVTYADLMIAAGHIANKNDIEDTPIANDLIDLIDRSEFYNGVPLNQGDRDRIRTVLDVVFHYTSTSKTNTNIKR